jgi:amino acid transporter
MLTIINIVVAVVILLLVTAAMAQIVIFDLSKKTKDLVSRRRWLVHKTIGQIGIGAAIIGILLVGSILLTIRRKRNPDPAEKDPW